MIARRSVLIACALTVACRGDAGVAPSIAPSVGADVSTPYPLDAGGVTGAPATYKGLPLALVSRPAPVILPVDGVIGVVCIGMSNANQECSRLQSAIAANGPWSGDVSAAVRVVNCAVGSHAIERWNDPAFDNVLWMDCIRNKVPARGLRVEQVRVLVHKAANQFGAGANGAALPLYPASGSNYERFMANLDAFAARVRPMFPNVQAVYTSSRSYGGYSGRTDRGEPQSYEEGHALNRWLADHATVDGIWYGWWGYLWAPDCSTGLRNGSSVCFDRADFVADAVHPSASGEIKLARIQHDRLRRETWYRRTP